ncbi:MAG: MIP family channel protein [Planctomycetota bacterium]
MSLPLFRRCFAELIGTFCLVVIGCGAIAVDSRTELLGHPGVAIVWGLIVMTMIYAIGDLSGAHINPAVSIAFAVVKRLPWIDALVYSVSQVLGAILGAAAIVVILGVDDSKLGSTMITVPPFAGLAVEFLMTAMLMFIVMGVSTGAKEKSITAGLAVGGTIAMQAFVAGPLTKASMNPARSLGPAIVATYPDHLWLYLVGPFAGAITGAWVYQALRGDDPQVP